LLEQGDQENLVLSLPNSVELTCLLAQHTRAYDDATKKTMLAKTLQSIENFSKIIYIIQAEKH